MVALTVEGEDLSDMRPRGLVPLQAREGAQWLVELELELFGPDLGWAGEVTAYCCGELGICEESDSRPFVPGVPQSKDASSTALLANSRLGTAPMRYLSLDDVPRILAFPGWGNWEKPQSV